MSDRTPGPWYVVGDPWGTGVDIVAGNPDPHVGRFVATTASFLEEEQDPRDDGQLRADAELIAAAPELLDRLREFTREARDYHDTTEHERAGSIIQCDAICEAMHKAETLLERLA